MFSLSFLLFPLRSCSFFSLQRPFKNGPALYHFCPTMPLRAGATASQSQPAIGVAPPTPVPWVGVAIPHFPLSETWAPARSGSRGPRPCFQYILVFINKYIIYTENLRGKLAKLRSYPACLLYYIYI